MQSILLLAISKTIATKPLGGCRRAMMLAAKAGVSKDWEAGMRVTIA